MNVAEGVSCEAWRRRRIDNTSRSRNEADDALWNVAIVLYYLRCPVLDIPHLIHPSLIEFRLM